jgi:hypothetical protein
MRKTGVMDIPPYSPIVCTFFKDRTRIANEKYGKHKRIKKILKRVFQQ